MLVHKSDAEEPDALTDVELVDDHERKVRDEQKKKRDAFDAVSDSTKMDVIGSSLGLDLVQLN